MTDANGIDIVSAKDIVFSAENDLKIKGKTISIEAGAPVSQPAAGATPPGLYLNTGLASIILKEDVTNIYGKPVKLEGTNKAPCPQPEEVEEDAEAEEDKMTAEDWAEIGLAVAGFIPSPGATAAVAVGETALAVHQGDYVGAGVSVLSGIPVVGGFVRVAKVMKKGKIARKILHLINKGKNLAKRVFKKIAKKAKSIGGKMKTLSSHMMADARKAIENAAKKIAGKTGKARPYSHLEDPPNVGPGKDFTAAQKKKIIEENKKMNNGKVRSDDPNDFAGESLVKPSKSQKGVTPPENEWQIDHIVAKANGGTNSYSNAQVLSRKQNRIKSDK
ncbi:HNH endonuclease [Anaerosinus massiliensis]|uniref:HNH endonuclease n=1 Tax=Massilibacillus massiliensis TaxID=1806837 RepID=UPI000A3F9BA5|nr:HNH endonuclease [Massilibacillus massiliensis]